MLEKERGVVRRKKAREPKRRLILSDSEEEEEDVAVAAAARVNGNSVGPPVEQNGGGLVVKERSDAEPGRSADEGQLQIGIDKSRDAELGVGKQGGDTEPRQSADEVQEQLGIDKSNDAEAGVAKQGGEAEADTVNRAADKVSAESRNPVVLPVEQNGGGLVVKERSDVEPGRSADEAQEHKSRDAELGAAEQSVEVEADTMNRLREEDVRAAGKVSVEEKSNGGEEIDVEKRSCCTDEEAKIEKKAVSVHADADKKRDEGDADNRGTERRKHEEELIIDENMGMPPDAVKRKADADTCNRKATERRNHEDVLRKFDMIAEVTSDRRKHDDGIKNDKKGSMVLHAVKHREEADTGMKRSTKKWNDEKKVDVRKKTAVRLDAVERRREPGSDNTNAMKKRKYEDVCTFDKRGDLKSGLSKQREDVRGREVTERRKDEERHRVLKKQAVILDAAKQQEVADSNNTRVAARRKEEELKINKRNVLRSEVDKYKVETRVHKKVPEKIRSVMFLKAEKEKSVGPDAAKHREEADSDMMNAVAKRGILERVRCEKELKYRKKRVTRADHVEQREEAIKDKENAIRLRRDKELKLNKRTAQSVALERKEVVNENEVSESELDSKAYRKRSMETPDTEARLKRFKPAAKHGQDRTREVDTQIIKTDCLDHREGRREAMTDRVVVADPTVQACRQRNGTAKKESPASLDNTVKSGAEKARSTEHSGQRTFRKLKDNNVLSDGIKEEDHKSIRMQGKSGVLIRLPSNKKVDGLERVHVKEEDEDRVETFVSTKSTATANHCTSKHPSLSGGKSVLAKPSSSSLFEKHKFCKAEAKHKTSSTTQKNVVISGKHDIVGKVGSKSTSKFPLKTAKGTSDVNGSRASFKKRIREQIREILLNAGWKIDLRPRRGRRYEDQVFIPPTGGGGYWSITKAYDVFQKQHKCDELSAKSSKESTGGSDGSSSAVPTELLSMLRRNVVNKRRKHAESEENQGSNSKKAKRTTVLDHSNNKEIGNGAAEGGGRGRKNNSMGSKTKDLSGKSNKRQRRCTLLVRGANQEADIDDDGYVPYIWKRTILSWLIDSGIVPINANVRYMNKKQKHSVLEGQVTRDGIRCSCCSKTVTVSKFEIHAGSKLCQPYQNIFLEESGISLLQCMVDAWEKQSESERCGFQTLDIEGDDPNDDTCSICADGGDLICCDGCPSTYHQSCLDIEMLPSGDWSCSNCLCRFCRVVSKVSSHGSGASLCPLLFCHLCEKKYHLECVPEEDVINANSKTYFCGRSCRKVFKQLQKYVGIKNDLEAGFSWRVIRRLDEDSLVYLNELPQRVECNAKIAVALAVMDECFLPIKDQRTGLNLIHNVVYNCGSNFSRLSYSGFYTFVLERGDEIISVASIRLHGTRLAEMPFIGTRNMYRRQGMCRRLLDGIESALCTLGIQKLIIPAISELTDTWTTVFGFKPLKAKLKHEIKSINMLVFPGIGLLQKQLVNTGLSGPSFQGKIAPDIKHHFEPVAAANSSVISSVLPNLHIPDANCNGALKDKEADSTCTALQNNTHSTSHVTMESEFQNSEHKSLECATEAKLSVHSEAVYDDESGQEDKFQVDFLAEQKVQLLCEDKLRDNHYECEGAGRQLDSQITQDASVPHTYVHDSVDASHLCSLHEPDESSKSGVLKRLHETKNGSDSLEQSFNSLVVDASVYSSLDTGSKSSDACKAILSSSEVEGCITSVSRCGGATHPVSPAATKDKLEMLAKDSPSPLSPAATKDKPEMLAKDSPSLIVSGSAYCVSVLGDSDRENCVNAPSASDCCVVPDTAKQHSDGGAGYCGRLSENSGTVPLEVLKQSLDSTVAAVHHNSTDKNNDADGPFERSQVSEDAAGSDILRDELVASRITNSVSLCSVPCASEMAVLSLDNASQESQSTKGSADVSI